VLGYPLASECFEGIHGLGIPPLGIDRTKKAPNVGLAGFKHKGNCHSGVHGLQANYGLG
jgi:hypothetical protein